MDPIYPSGAFFDLLSLMMWCQVICIGGMFVCFVLAILLDGNKKD